MSWQDLMEIEAARDLIADAHASQNPKKFLQPTPIVVAVLDSGCDVAHRSLAPVLVEAISFAKNVKGSKNMLPDEAQDHGTLSTGLVAGIASSGDDFLGGVARPGSGIAVGLIAARYNDTLSIKNDIETLVALAKLKVRAISNSYGWGRGVMGVGPSQQLGRAITELQASGVVSLYAAGNDGRLIPANDLTAMRDAVLVASTVFNEDDGEVFSAYSNFAVGITVCAPGGDSSGERPVSTSNGNTFATHANTSAACPMVAGVVALVLTANPALTAADVKEILCLTADQIDPNCAEQIGRWGLAAGMFGARAQTLPASLLARPYSQRYGFGRVNARAAVAEAIARK